MKRWYFYAAIGLVFGIFDWFYLHWLTHIQWGALRGSPLVILLTILLNYGIWLVLIIPVVTVAARQRQKARDPIGVGILTWIFALVGYYAYYWALLSLGKLPNLGYLDIFGENFARYQLQYWRMVRRVIMYQFLEWSLIAIIGGGVIGALAWWIFRKKK